MVSFQKNRNFEIVFLISTLEKLIFCCLRQDKQQDLSAPNDSWCIVLYIVTGALVWSPQNGVAAV